MKNMYLQTVSIWRIYWLSYSYEGISINNYLTTLHTNFTPAALGTTKNTTTNQVLINPKNHEKIGILPIINF